MIIPTLFSIFVTIPVLILCQHCGPQQHSPETTIDQDSTDVVVLSEIKDTSQKKCFKSCCSIMEEDGCNAVVYQHSSKTCTLVKCLNEAGCLLKPDEDFVTTSIGIPVNTSTTTTSLSNSTVTESPNDTVDSTTPSDEIIKPTVQTGVKEPEPTLKLNDGDDTTTDQHNDASTTLIIPPDTAIQSDATTESTIKPELNNNDAPATSIIPPDTAIQSETTTESTKNPELTTIDTLKDDTTFTTTPFIRNTTIQSTSSPPTSHLTTILSSKSTEAFSTLASLSETTTYSSTSANSRIASESLMTTTSNSPKQTESSITMPSTVTLSTLSDESITSKWSEIQRTNSSVNTNQPEKTFTISGTNLTTAISNTSSLYSNETSNGTEYGSPISSVFPPTESSVVSTQQSKLINETSYNHVGINITTAANINTNSSMDVNNSQSDSGQQTNVTTNITMLNTLTTSEPEAHTTQMNVSEHFATLTTSEVTMKTPLETTKGPSTSATTGLNTESSNASSRVSSGKHFYASQDDQLPALLIAALSIGIVFVFAVFVLLGKRVFDSWQRRHYSRVDYLINGMYN